METKRQIAETHLEMIRAKGGLNSFVELCELNDNGVYYNFRLYLSKKVFISCQSHIGADMPFITYAFQLECAHRENKPLKLTATNFDEALLYLEKKAIDDVVKDSINAISNVGIAVGLILSISPKNSLLQAGKKAKDRQFY